MTSRERVECVFQGHKPDHVPVLPQIGDHAGWIEGLTMDVIYHDAQRIADAHLKAYRRYGYDVLAVQVEPSWPVAEACGCAVTYPPEKCPWITDNVIKSAGDVDKVRVPDFQAHSGTRTILEATARLKEEVGGEAMVAGYMTGPLTFALQLMPYNDFIVKTRKDPAFVDAVVAKATEVARAFAVALKEAGAELFVTCEHDLQMLSPKALHDYILPNLPSLTSVLPYNVLHMCGKVEPHLTHGADGIAAVPDLQFVNFSAEVSIAGMAALFGDRLGLCGNIDHIHLLTAGTPDEVREACRRAIEEGRKGKAFMLGPGCEITTDTPPENVAAFVESAALYGGMADGSL